MTCGGSCPATKLQDYVPLQNCNNLLLSLFKVLYQKLHSHILGLALHTSKHITMADEQDLIAASMAGTQQVPADFKGDDADNFEEVST